MTGSGALCLFGDVHPAEAQSPCDEITRGSFTVQNHIDVSTIDAVALCKSDLTSFAFNSSSQQANNIIVLKHTRLKTQITENQGRTLTSCALPWACPKASFFPIQGLFKPTVGADARRRRSARRLGSMDYRRGRSAQDARFASYQRREPQAGTRRRTGMARCTREIRARRQGAADRG